MNKKTKNEKKMKILIYVKTEYMHWRISYIKK